MLTGNHQAVSNDEYDYFWLQHLAIFTNAICIVRPKPDHAAPLAMAMYNTINIGSIRLYMQQYRCRGQDDSKPGFLSVPSSVNGNNW